MAATAAFKPGGHFEPQASVKAFRLLGDWLNQTLKSQADIARIVTSGVQIKAIDQLRGAGYSQRELEWIIPVRTLKRRAKESDTLVKDEADRLVRALWILSLATTVMGNEEKAQRWLSKPRKQFDGQSANEMMHTEAGAKVVENALNRLDSGYFA